MKFYPKISICGFAFVVWLLAASGTIAAATSPTADKLQTDKETRIMQEFYQRIQTNRTPAQLLPFITENIPSVSPYSASVMVLQLERAQLAMLPWLQSSYENEEVQNELKTDFSRGIQPDIVQKEALKKLWIITRSNGFKLETAEGMYFPVIDYSAVRAFRTYVTPDIAAYIDIMFEESEAMPVKDGALRLGWEELAVRAEERQLFLHTYSGSIKAGEIEKLYTNYLACLLFGTNNTPMFHYEDQQMDAAAIKAYQGLEPERTEKGIGKILKDFIEIAARNNYKLTPEVDSYRREIFSGSRQAAIN